MRNLCLVGPVEKDSYLVKTIEQSMEYNITLIIGTYDFSGDYTIADYCYLENNRMDALFEEVIICESRQCSDEYLLRLIKHFLEAGKVVKNYHKFGNVAKAEIREYKNKYLETFFNQINEELEQEHFRLPESTIPTVYVVSLSGNMQKMEVELGIKKELEKRGYAVSWLCSNPIGEYMEGIPYLNRVSCNEMREFANDFGALCYEEEEKGKEVLLIGVPECFFSAEQSSVGLQIMKKICEPDYVVLNVYDNALINNNAQEMLEIPVSALGKGADEIVLTATISDVVKYEIFKPSETLYIGDNRNHFEVSQPSFVLRSDDENAYVQIVDKLINKLT